MALNKVTYVDGSTKIKAENLNNIQDSIIANEQSIAALKLAEAEDGVELLGQTPITLSNDVSTLLLSTNGDCSYTIVTDTLADLTTASITYRNAEKIDYEGYFDIKSTRRSG